MELPSETKKALTTIVSTTLIMILVGILYAVLFVQPNLHAILNGIAIGGVIGIVSSAAEVFVFSRFRQKFTFGLFLVVRTLFYVVLACSATFYIIARHAALMHSMTFAQALASPEFEHFLFGGEFLRIVVYGLAMSFFVNFVRQVNRLLGHNALLDYIT